MRKIRKIISLIAGVVVIGVVMAGCSEEEGGNKPNLTIEQSNGGSGGGVEAKEQRIENKYAWSGDGNYTGRTRIENGVLTEWAEEYPMDKTNKPIRYEDHNEEMYHSLFYNVDGQGIEVVVDDEEGYHKNARLFYEEGKTNNFAEVQVSDKSNEAVFKSVAANRKLNEVIEEKYRK